MTRCRAHPCRIERDGPITFARFMDLALYDPDGGYYRADAARPGRRATS
jgi:SAM-dependent MidA family methyltransferase